MALLVYYQVMMMCLGLDRVCVEQICPVSLIHLNHRHSLQPEHPQSGQKCPERFLKRNCPAVDEHQVEQEEYHQTEL